MPTDREYDAQRKRRQRHGNAVIYVRTLTPAETAPGRRLPSEEPAAEGGPTVSDGGQVE